MNSLPLVSICIPTYNGEEYISEALESAAAQTYPNIEIVISDDASQDRTLQIIEDFRDKLNLEINVFHHEPSGIGANWNNCIKQAKGEYIKFLFQDDLLFSTCVEELLNPFIHDKRIGMTACKRKIILEGQKSQEQELWLNRYSDLQKEFDEKEDGFYLFTSKNLLNDKFVKNNKIGEPTTVLFKRSILKKVGFINEELIQVVDFEFYYRILKKYNIVVINKELAAFRVHPTQATNKNKDRISADYEKYYKLLYLNFFWYLSKKFQKDLFKRYHPISNLYRYIRY